MEKLKKLSRAEMKNISGGIKFQCSCPPPTGVNYFVDCDPLIPTGGTESCDTICLIDQVANCPENM
jgi:hypothetical protein